MKRGTPDHPKVIDLCEELGRRRPEVLGILELLWHFTSKYAPQGDIGRFSDARIEAACDWNGKRGRLIEALRKTSWIDEHKQYRLLVHDWSEHADGATKKRLIRDKKHFYTCQSDTGKLTGQCLDRVEPYSHYVPDNGCLPIPNPNPEPNPIPSDRRQFDHESHFEVLWSLYPQKGRTRRPLSEQVYIELTSATPDPWSLSDAILAPIRPGGKWDRSKLWSNGFVSALADYLKQKRWLEDPEPAEKQEDWTNGL